LNQAIKVVLPRKSVVFKVT